MNRPLALLYVDDDPDIRTIVEMALGLDTTIAVRTAESGAAALALIDTSAWRPDIVVLDVMMPGLSGIDTLAALRTRADLAEIPAVFMTARARAPDIAQYHAHGAVGVILKPFDPVLLASEIRRLSGLT